MLRELPEKYRAALAKAYDFLRHQMNERINVAANDVVVQVEGRLQTFADDAVRRRDRLGTPLSKEDVATLERLRQDIESVGSKVRQIRDELAVLVSADDRLGSGDAEAPKSETRPPNPHRADQLLEKAP